MRDRKPTRSDTSTRARRLGTAMLLALVALACDEDGPLVDVANTPPEAADQSVTTPKNTAVDITLQATDAEGDPMTFSIASAPDNGTLSAFSGATASSVQVTYTPNAGFSGSDSFTFTASDGENTSEAATVDVTVENAVPVAEPATATTAKNTAVQVTLRGTDADDGETLTFDIETPPENGTLEEVAAPTSVNETTATVTMEYTPDTGFGGDDTFTYTVSDGTDSSDPATVTITVENEAPSADDQSVTTARNTAVTITLTGSDPDGDALTFAIATQPGNGSLGDIGNAMAASADVTYTPDTGFSGTDTFTFTVSDGSATSTEATVTVTVSNEAPVADDKSATTAKNTAVEVTLTGTDPDGDALTFSIASQPTDGSLSALSGETATSAKVTYTPDTDFTGTDTFTYTVTDGTDTSAPATVTVTVENQQPTADDASESTFKDVTVTVTMTGSDPDGDPLTFAIDGAPLNGSLGAIMDTDATDGNAQVDYTPNAGFVGSDVFTFTVTDGTNTSDPGTVTITVTNRAPTADAQTVATTVDTAVTITLTGSDPDGDALTFSIGTGPTDGSLGAVSSTGDTSATVTYTPDTGFTGSDSFTFTVSDGSATSDPVTVTVNVS